jgi:hypothetical protein
LKIFERIRGRVRRCGGGWVSIVVSSRLAVSGASHA